LPPPPPQIPDPAAAPAPPRARGSGAPAPPRPPVTHAAADAGAAAGAGIDAAGDDDVWAGAGAGRRELRQAAAPAPAAPAPPAAECPPPPAAVGGPEARPVAELFAELTNRFPQLPAGAAFTAGRAAEIAALLGGRNASADADARAASFDDDNFVQSARGTTEVDPQTLKPRRRKRRNKSPPAGDPKWWLPALMSDPACPVASRLTRMTCYTDPVTLNVVTLSYETSVDDTVYDVCTPCPGCASSVVDYDTNEYTTVLTVYMVGDFC
jgi:hypothetical protein